MNTSLAGGGVHDALDDLADWHTALRSEFPILTRQPDVAYLDSAATAQKPQHVLDRVHDYLTTSNANAGRGSYPWANATTAAVEQARQAVRALLGDTGPESSVELVSGASEGLRRVAQDWLGPILRDGDEIVVPFGDHQANLQPWLELQHDLARQGTMIMVRPLPVDPASGDYAHREFAAVLSPRTRFVAATGVHHVYGTDLNVHRIRAAVGPDVPICLDAAQAVGHRPVLVDDLDVDFIVFSGHKMMALPGTGAIWARNVRGPRLSLDGWAGTANTVGAVSLTAAVEWLDRADVGRIQRWCTALCAVLTDGLSRLPDVTVLGCQDSLAAASTIQRRESLVTFRHRRVRSDDLGFVLAANGLMTRCDAHCQAGRDGDDHSVRVSVHAYTSVDEIRRVLDLVADCG